MCMVSHIIPVYNGGEQIRRTVKSILNQTFRDFELIIIDDGSTDRATVELVDELAKQDARIKVVHQTNHGVYETSDTGMRLASGKYVYLCGQDDYLHPQLFELATNLCERHKLDYIALRWQNVQADSMPETLHYVEQMLPVDIVDNNLTDDVSFFKALEQVHTDAWAQFMRRELSVRFPSRVTGQTARTFKCVDASKRWGVIRAPLYYYTKTNFGGSLMHKPIYADWVDELHCEMANVYDLAKTWSPERFIVMRKMHVVPGVRTVFHLVKRSSKRLGRSDKVKLWQAFSRMAADFVFVRRIPINQLGLKHYFEYMFVAFFYGGIKNPEVNIQGFHGSSKRAK